jgi:arsenate reductase-like glutaredoxin family protein
MENLFSVKNNSFSEEILSILKNGEKYKEIKILRDSPDSKEAIEIRKNSVRNLEGLLNKNVEGTDLMSNLKNQLVGDNIKRFIEEVLQKYRHRSKDFLS